MNYISPRDKDALVTMRNEEKRVKLISLMLARNSFCLYFITLYTQNCHIVKKRNELH